MKAKGWAVVRPGGQIELSSIASSPRKSKQAMRFLITWKQAYGQGFRCVPVGVLTITEKISELTDELPRAEELAERLCVAGPKAAYVSASETHEIKDFVLAAAGLIRSLVTITAKEPDHE